MERGRPNNPEMELGITIAQRYSFKIGCPDLIDRDQGVNLLMEPSRASVAAMPELLQILLDKDCPGAACPPFSQDSAIEALHQFRERRLIGSVDFEYEAAGQAAFKALRKRTRDEDWHVRLAAAEALASLAFTIKPPIDFLNRHANGQDEALSKAAKHILAELKQAGGVIDPVALSKQAGPPMRDVFHPDFDPGDPQEKKFAQAMSKPLLRRLWESRLIKETQEDKGIQERWAAESKRKLMARARREEACGNTPVRTISSEDGRALMQSQSMGRLPTTPDSKRAPGRLAAAGAHVVR
eukprot:TRINITY_DN18118_c3_g1_i1.p1 TRINITY_DN18118_c3_g1~~TRINITY_DN18118_c3_g1_i1.p1  ORF type:complete len:326 (+),score=61.02 TRINITY_DN18118_c3_g1_i1:89-979(+)